MNIKPFFAWFDFWMGIFYDHKKRRIYVLPVPMCGVVIQLSIRCPRCGHPASQHSAGFGNCDTCKPGQGFCHWEWWRTPATEPKIEPQE